MAEGLELEGPLVSKFEPVGGSGTPIQRVRLPYYVCRAFQFSNGDRPPRSPRDRFALSVRQKVCHLTVKDRF